MSSYKETPESKSAFVKKYPEADMEHQRGIFLRFGFICALGFALFAFTWTTYDNKESSLGPLVVDEEIIVEPPQTKQEKPPPPPPPPPKLDIVKDEEKVEDDPIIKEMDVDEDTEIEILEIEEDVIDENEIFMIVEDPPAFPGGPNALQQYLLKAPYPPIASENDIEGTVWVYFVVDKDGSVINVKVARGVDQTLDRAALKHVKAMPKWNPGKQRGKPVKVSFNVRLVYTLVD